MSEHTDATEDRPDDDDVEASREDLDELGGGGKDDEGPQPWAKTSSGEAE
ncbi:MAG: hypothetical protein M3R12_08255 [Actinomycetota bacterium]|nr:hypothetical protein [Actinomycetota bacterium]